MSEPKAVQRPYTHQEHGVERPDPYAWMRDRQDPELMAYLASENTYTEARTAHLETLRKTLFDELLGRIQEDDASVPSFRPSPDGGWWVYSRTEAGRPYPTYARKRTLEAPEEILLDVNALAEGLDYLHLGGLALSPDQRLLAYATDTTGREVYDVHVLDLATGETLPDVITDIWPDLTWATDNRTLLYARLDDSLRPHQIVKHTLGTPVSDDVVLYQEDDDRFRVAAERTLDDRWILLSSDSATTTEVRYAPADLSSAFTVFAPRHPGHEYAVDSHGDGFLVLTNDADDAQGEHTQAAVNFALKRATPGHTGRSDWTMWIPHRDDVTLEGMHSFAEAVVLEERQDGLTHFRILRDDGADFRLVLPEAVHVASMGDNPAYASPYLRLHYTSLTTPDSIYDADLTSGVLTLRKEQPVLGGFDKSAYTSARLMAPSADGTLIPVSVVHRKDVPLDGNAPLLLYGYGAYGITIDPAFRSSRLSLLDRGVVFAIAPLRGGGFLGRRWKEAGKFEHKQHTFDDFIAAGRHLVAQGYTSHERMAIQGGSAGGLLIGAVVNQAPELAAHAVAQVPFVDVVSTMLDASIPLTTNEWEEWGDPREKRWFDVMLAYSPYDNVSEGPYPDLLVISGLNDPRVQYWEPTKWVARLRDRAAPGSELLLKMEMGSGHGGKSGRYGHLDDIAFVHAWLLDKWGLTPTA